MIHLSKHHYDAYNHSVQTHYNWNIDSSDYHSLARALSKTIRVSGYDPTMTNEAALRISLSAVQRAVLFCADVPKAVREPDFYRKLLLKDKECKGMFLVGLEELWKDKGKSTHDDDEHDEHPDKELEEEEPNLKLNRINRHTNPRSPTKSPSQRLRSREVLREYNAVSRPHPKHALRREKISKSREKELVIEERRKSSTYHEKVRFDWDAKSIVRRPTQFLEGNKSAYDPFLEECHPEKAKAVNGKVKSMYDPEYREGNWDIEGDLHGAPNLKRDNQYGNYYNRHNHKHKNHHQREEEEEEELKKRDVYNFMLRLGVVVRQADLGLIGDEEAGNSNKRQNENKNDDSKTVTHPHNDHHQHRYSKHITVKHSHPKTTRSSHPKVEQPRQTPITAGNKLSHLSNLRSQKFPSTTASNSCLRSPLQNGTIFSELGANIIVAQHGLRDALSRVKVIDNGRRVLMLGSVERPTSRAQTLHNVECGMKVLVSDEKVNGQNLFRSADIVDGDMNAAWGLLFAIYDAYKHLHAMNRKQHADVRESEVIEGAVRRNKKVLREAAKNAALPRPKSSSRGSSKNKNATRADALKSKKLSPAVAETETETMKLRENLPQPPQRKPQEEQRHPPKPPSKLSTAEQYSQNHSLLLSALALSPTPSSPSSDSSSLHSISVDDPQVILPTHKAKTAVQKPVFDPLPPSFDDDYHISYRMTTSPPPPPSDAMTTAVKRWLHRLGINGFTVDTTSVRHTMLIDNLRNGTILCSLAQLLEPRKTNALNFANCVRGSPCNEREVLVNVCAALNVFKSGQSPPINLRLLIDPDAIISGDTDFVDNLLYEMMNAYPRSAGFFHSDESWYSLQQKNRSWLQYTPLQRQCLEQCLIQWLIDNGTLQSLGLHDRIAKSQQLSSEKDFYSITRDEITGKMREFLSPNLLDIEDVLRDGTLLCQLAVIVLPPERRALVKGWIRYPKTRRCKLNNCTKVLNGLKGWFNQETCCHGCSSATGVGMSSRWLKEGMEERVVDGDWREIIGLLEDVWRCVGGMQPKGHAIKGVEVPFFGKYACAFYRKDPSIDDLEEKKEEEEKKVEIDRIIETREFDLFVSDTKHQPEEERKITASLPIVKAACLADDIVPDPCKRSAGIQIDRDINKNDLAVLSGGEADEAFEAALRRNEAEKAENDRFNESIVKVEEALNAAKSFAQSILDKDEGEMVRDAKKVVETEKSNKDSHEHDSHKHDSNDDDDDDDDDDDIENYGFFPANMNHLYLVSKWLSTKFSIDIDDPKSFLEKPFKAHEFTSGLKLVSIAEKLLRREISGVSKYPRTKAARVVNCKRALEALFNNLRVSSVGIELTVSSRESYEQVAAGNARVIVELLMGLKKLYDFRRV